MRDLLDAGEEFRPRLRSWRKLCVLAGPDGALAPHADDPGTVELPRAAKQALASLLGTQRASVGVLSGRPLSDLEARVGMGGAWYAVNHG